MPWGPNDASGHDKKAKSAKQKRQWAHVANSVLERTGDEGLAVREANGVIKGMHGSASNYKHHRPKQKVLQRHF